MALIDDEMEPMDNHRNNTEARKTLDRAAQQINKFVAASHSRMLDQFNEFEAVSRRRMLDQLTSLANSSEVLRIAKMNSAMPLQSLSIPKLSTCIEEARIILSPLDMKSAIEQICIAEFSNLSGKLDSLRVAAGEAFERDSLSVQIAKKAIEDSITSSVTAFNDFMRDAMEFRISKFLEALDPIAAISCDVETVSVEVAQDAKPMLSAKYNRTPVIDLLMAKLALEDLNSDRRMTSSTLLEEPHTLKACTREHNDHYAVFHWATRIEDCSEGQSETINATEWLKQLRDSRQISEEDWKQIEFDARLAEVFIREVFPYVVGSALRILIAVGILGVKENPVSSEELRAKLEEMMIELRSLLPAPDVGRPEGTGWFDSEADFEQALKDVFSKFSKRPTRERTVKELREHPLCKRQSESDLKNQTRTLLTWIKKLGVKNYTEAWEKYGKPSKSGK